ncbi:MAG: hypothetical protein WD847_17370 [Pirellulales bacterium]
MSTLDQAFIRAYQKQDQQVSTAQPAEQGRASGHPPIAAPHIPLDPVAPDSGRVAHPPGASAPAAVETSKAPEPMLPAYEVQRFEWPDAVNRLLEDPAGYFCDYLPTLTGATRPRSILVTGCRRGEGRTTLAMALARLAAGKLGKVALVEADFGRPQLADQLGIVPQAGWQDLLFGQQPLSEALVESLAEPVTLLPATSLAFGARTARVATRVQSVIESLVHQYALVCIDGGPWIGAAGDRRMSILDCHPMIDAALVVRDTRHSTMEDCQAVGRSLARYGIAQWDIVETFVRA